MLAEYPIKISGVKGRPITQYFQLNIGTEFAFGAGVRALIRRKDLSKDIAAYDNVKHPFACLLDQSCQLAKRNEKNHIHLNIVLTSGEYLL